MAEVARVPRFVQVANALMALLLRRGVKIATNTLITVPGRKSGLPRTTPVTIVEYDGERYVQSPYGEVDWVRNLRAAGSARLTRGRHSEAVSATELTNEAAAPILKHVLMMAPSIIRSYYNVAPDAPLEDFVIEARRHPTFELRSASAHPRPIPSDPAARVAAAPETK